MGGTSHRHQTLASQVAYAQIVLGSGEVVHTSPTFERDVHDCVFGGAGRFGVITSVELALEHAPPVVSTYSLRYRDYRALSADMLRLADLPGVRSLVAFNDLSAPKVCEASSGRRAATLALRLAIEGDSAGPFVPLSALNHEAVRGPEAISLGQFLRLDDGPSQHSGRGAARRPATLGAFLPETGALPLLLEQAFETTSPVPCRLVVVASGKLPSAIAFPATPRAIALIAPIQPRSFGGEEHEPLLALQRRLYRAGGRLFPTSVGVRHEPGFWRTHYAANYERIAMLKRRFDPAGILRSQAGELR